VTEAYGIKDNPFEKTRRAFLSGKKGEMIAIFPVYSQAIKTLTDLIDQLPVKEQV
jgi:hypothetical protein